MKTYSYSGFGNYSQSFDWDGGLNVNINPQETTLPDHLIYGIHSNEYFDRDTNKTAIVYVEHFNDYAGSRTESGYVQVESYEEAIEVMKHYCDEQYPVTEYERDYIDSNE